MPYSTHPLTKLRALVDSINPENIVVPKSVLQKTRNAETEKVTPREEPVLESKTQKNIQNQLKLSKHQEKSMNQLLLETLMKQSEADPKSDQVSALFQAVEEQKQSEEDVNIVLQSILLKQILNNIT